MKRTRSINLQRMRKTAPSRAEAERFAVKPMVLGIAAAGLLGCSDQREAYVYESVEECTTGQPQDAIACQTAYQEALAKHRSEGPRYGTQEACEGQFGPGGCESAGGFFMPMMAGFLFSSYLNRAYSPMYSSSLAHSPYYGKWTTADGERYPRGTADKKVVLTQRTISRGGFGSTTAARSKWGGSSSRSSWGG
jgi:uncharacterized protein YgiB involved in biofilm formation